MGSKRQATHTLVYLWKPTDLAAQSRMASNKAGKIMWGMKRQEVGRYWEVIGSEEKFSILQHSRASVADNRSAFLSV